MSASGRVRTRLLAASGLPILVLVLALAAGGQLTLPATFGVLVLTTIVAGVVWATVRPIERMADAADRLSEERLPQLLEALMNPGDADETYLAATIEPIDVSGAAEVRKLARAYNDLQSHAVTVAARQASLLRKGITDLYVNLARRNQSLLERQIKLLDRLEAAEQDPDVLENLYQLDHLSTRMRRNAESLLVLADADSTRRSRPLPVVDVVRAALSEVEAYDRVDVGAMAAATVHGPAVSDVAHILAELIENAAQFSPPHTRVTVEGSRTGGSYQVVVTDEGLGLTDEQLASLNDVLRDPPVTGLALGPSLGCLVAARLAARHGITVRLRPAPARGVAAYVILPRHLVSDDTVLAPPTATDDRPRPTPAPRVVEQPTPPPAPVAPFPAPSLTRPTTAPDDRPRTLREALPALDSFNAGILSLLGEAPTPAEAPITPATPITPDMPATPDPARTGPEVEPEAAQSVEEPPAGQPPRLVRRVPGASQPVGGDRPQGSAPRRSPEEVRSMLSEYRSGLSAGRHNLSPPQGDRPE